MRFGPLTADAQATLLICSYLALPKGPAALKLNPLAPSEWNDLAAAVHVAQLRPGALLDMDIATMQSRLSLTPERAERIIQLLSRGAQLAVEVERLGSLGIWTLTRSDEAYPALLKDRLGVLAPPVLFGAGDPTHLAKGFLAVVGSREVDEIAAQFAHRMGEACARAGLVLVSGGAKGVDRLSMLGSLQAGGTVVGVVADSLERVARDPEFRAAIAAGRLTLISAVHPKAPFTTANAMARNKFIYCLAKYGLAVSASLEKGGTRAGALEVMQHRWVPLFVRGGSAAPPGNHDLIKRGALEFPPEVPPTQLAAFFAEQASAWAAGVRPGRRRSLLDPLPCKADGSGRPAEPPLSTEEDDLFPVVWPHIKQRLAKWPTAEELAEHLRVEYSQVREWLERAIRLGVARQAPDPGTYCLPGESPQGEQIRFDV